MTLAGRFAGKMRDMGITAGGGGSCLAAVSGGGDSTALLVLAAEWAAEKGGGRPGLYAARVNHGIRAPEIEAAETAMVRGLCGALKVPFADLRAERGRILRLSRGRGVEQAARTERHGLLEGHRRALGADFILFGHSADDQLETVLMRIFSGAGPEGLKGIPESRGPIRRPLLGESRESLRRFLVSRGIQWAEDAGNTEKRFRRSRVRNELLPLIDDIFPGRISALALLARRSAEAAEAFADLGERELPLRREARGWGFSRGDWEAAPAYLRCLALLKGLNVIGAEAGDAEVEGREARCRAAEGAEDRGGEAGGAEVRGAGAGGAGAGADGRISWRRIDELRRAVDEHRSVRIFGWGVTSEGGRIILSRDEGRGGEGRIILGRADVRSGAVFSLGPLTVRAALHGDAGGSGGEAPPRVFPIHPHQWPLSIRVSNPPGDFTVHSEGGLEITERLFEREFDDDAGEMVYIQVDYAPETE